MLRRLNDALPGLVAGIVFYGIVIQLAGMWFVDDKLNYTVGLWYGIAIAVWMAVNLAQVIMDSVTLGDAEHANRRIIAKSVLRYVVVVILFFVLGYFKFGNLLAALVGLLGLKISAYIQPIAGRVISRLLGRGDANCTGETEMEGASAETSLEPTEDKLNKEVTL